MTSICPKCRYQRQPHDTAPEWQCPACGVAYAKALAAGLHQSRTSIEEATPPFPWGKVLLGALLFAGAGWLLQTLRETGNGFSASAANAVETRALAQQLRAQDVKIYTTSTCPYCHQAKDWLQQQGFAYEECNIETDERCAAEFRAAGQQGVPYLIVAGQPMASGFNANEFLQRARQAAQKNQP